MKGLTLLLPNLDEHRDVADTQKAIEEKGRRCLALSGDITHLPIFVKRS
ncbi:hypothetical protein [Coxiella endosymbiont of Ornithodoros maritimus]|nr:hypothetical protein [Coxiella endosymbiont of Ornithodoros maritimus]